MIGEWGGKADGCREENAEEEEEAGLRVFLGGLQRCDFLFLTSNQMRHFTGLPVGALSSHCIFPVRNDVGSVVLDDVVVILSIWGKGLGGTGHLGL